MAQQIIIPDNRDHWKQLRSQDITSTEMAALFGLSPYITEFELYHRHLKNEVVDIEETERMKWGTRLESAIAQGVLEDLGWQGRPMKEYIRLDDIRIGASFDWRIQTSKEVFDRGMGDESVPADGADDGLLEIKNVDALMFRDGWIVDEDGNVEAPPHIEIQVQQQMMVSGLKWARIAALVGGNTVAIIERKLDEDVVFSIIEKATKFWERIETQTPPAPDFIQDADFIKELYKQAEPGTIIDITQETELTTLAATYKSLADQIKGLEDQRAGIKSQLLMAIGEHEKAIGNGFSISASMIGPTEISYTRKGYRDFRVNWKKVKA